MRTQNVVVCLCDQLRPFELGCYGNRSVRTPNIDRLAHDGVRVEIACTNGPVCTPARSILLTGQYARTCTGSVGNLANSPPATERVRLTDTTLAEALRAANYRTGLIGKWHIHPSPMLVGFDHVNYPNYSHRYTNQSYSVNDGPEQVVPGFAPDYESDSIDKFIAERTGTATPFFLFHSIAQPHMPLADGPERYTRAFSRDDVAIRANAVVNGKLAFDQEWFRIYRWDYLYYRQKQPHTLTLSENYDLKDMYAEYYGMVSCADDQVGRLISALERQGILDDTIIVFTSDHGDNLGSHGRFNKDCLIEEAYRIPMIIHWNSGLPPGVVKNAVISLADVMPTVLGLLGLPNASTVQGTDRSSLLRGELVSEETCAFIETDVGEIGIRTPTHLYGMRMDGGGGDNRPLAITEQNYLFYDFRSDPLQMHNLIGGREQQDIAEQLRQRLLKWNSETPWRVVPI